jgi:hypothetical protein
MSSFLLGPAGAAQTPSSPPAAPPMPPARPADASRSSTLSVIAFVGVLLLAMGVGVLIGRAGNGKQSAPPAQVVTVDTPGSSGSSEAPFSSDWPSATNGYTVQLQTLPASGTSLGAVEAAKTSASSKGATAVGALKSEEFSTLPSGNYVIYSGVYHTKAAAQKALSSLKKSFPAASVIHVGEGSGSGGSGSASSGTGSSGSGGGVGSSPTKPAPPSVLKNLDKHHGKSYEERSKNLPNVVETG